MNAADNLVEWDKIAEKIALETIFTFDQALTFIDDLKYNGADAAIYGEQLYNAVSTVSSYLLAQIMANRVYNKYLAESGFTVH